MKSKLNRLFDDLEKIGTETHERKQNEEGWKLAMDDSFKIADKDRFVITAERRGTHRTEGVKVGGRVFVTFRSK